jgi:hypothetical protein
MKRIVLCAALLAWSGVASAIVYKWVDAKGEVQYGDRPPDGVHAEVVEWLGGRVTRTPQPPPAAAGSPARPRPAAAAPGATTDAVQKAVDQDVADAREKQCAEAQDRYKKDIEGRRLYKMGENGERVYLTSEEIDAERLNAKREVDAVCAGTS